jgi:hypothetical protein
MKCRCITVSYTTVNIRVKIDPPHLLVCRKWQCLDVHGSVGNDMVVVIYGRCRCAKHSEELMASSRGEKLSGQCKGNICSPARDRASFYGDALECLSASRKLAAASVVSA